MPATFPNQVFNEDWLMKQLFNSIHKSTMSRKHEAMEAVSKKILNKFGYPNNIEVFSFQQNNDLHFVDVLTNEVVAKIEMKNYCFHIWTSSNLN